MFARLSRTFSIPANFAWWGAVVLYICIQGSLHAQIIQGRTQPINIDDSYTYIWQAARLDVCRQSCPALDTLSPIFQTPSSDFMMNTLRVDKISRLLSVYAPLEEGGLLLFQRITDLDWGSVYFVFIAIGVVLQAVGIGLLLRALWGEWAAAIGLIMVAVTVYNAQGLHYIVPSNITLTIAMIVWAFLIKEGRNAWRALIIGTIVLVLAHPIGRLYALTALALYITAGHWWPTRREVAVVTVVLAIIGSYWLFAIISTAPPMDVKLAFFNPEFPTYFDLVRYQLVDILNKLGLAVQKFTILPLFLLNVLLLIKAFTLVPGPQQRRRSVWIFFALTLGMFVVAAFTNRPADPNEGNRRIIIIVHIVLTGGLGALITWSLGYIKGLLNGRFRLKNGRQLAELLLVSVVVTLCCGTWILRVLDTASTWSDSVKILTDFENFQMEREDLDTLLRQPEATILYVNQVAMLYGLSNGLHRFEAIYLPVLDTPPDLTKVDYILGLQVDPARDPLEKLEIFFPDHSVLENFILVEGLKSDLRLYARRP